MDRLPDSIVLEIIVRSAKYQPGAYEFCQGRLFGCVQPLCRMRMVSKRFKALVSQTENIAWDFQGQEEMEARAIRFMSAAERIRGLKLKNIVFGTDYHLSIGFLAGVVALTPALTIFELSGFTLDVKAIFKRETPFLRPATHVAPKTADERAHQLLELLSQYVDLTSLHLAFKVPIMETMEITSPLSSGLVFWKLKNLFLGSLELSDVALSAFVGQSPALETLIIESDFEMLERPKITSASLLSLELQTPGNSSSQLDELIIDCPMLSHLLTLVPARMVVAAPNLRTLNLIKCEGYEVDDSPSCTIEVNVPWKVEKLSMMGYGEWEWEQDDFKELCNMCPNLRVFELDGESMVGRNMDFLGSLVSCKAIEKLQVHASTITSAEDGASPTTSALAMLAQFTKLKHLEVQVWDEAGVDACGKLAALCTNVRTFGIRIIEDENSPEYSRDQIVDKVRQISDELERIRPDLTLLMTVY
jgi:hypothetical protein